MSTPTTTPTPMPGESFICACGAAATWHGNRHGHRMLACLDCAHAAGMYDHQVLPTLADRIAQRTTGIVRTPAGKAWSSLRPRRKPWRRDKLLIAARWLRRFVGGCWYRGGHHVGRPFGGPMLAEYRGRWYAEMRDEPATTDNEPRTTNNEQPTTNHEQPRD